MTKWLISDTHLFHAKILDFQRNSFSTVEEMNNYIVQMWKDIIKPDDTVYHLGDFAFGKDFEAIENIVKELPGKVTLLLGNHDTPAKVQIYAKYWKLASAISIEGYILSHMPVNPMILEENTPRSNGIADRYNIHGHCHRGNVPDKRYFNVNWDVLDEKKILRLSDVKDFLRSNN